ncbi:MAG TPA: recombinase RecA [Candidatus Babeliales bacterium]|nr:recombinase RecA [Candidatus Babeliales bacterium]
MTKELLSSKRQALDAAFSQIEKSHGKGSVMLLGETPHQEVETISTGSLLIDWAIGVGGFPRGRVVEIFGPEASGKTTLALHVIAQAQKAGGLCAFIDAEHALDAAHAAKLGVNVDELVISQPDYGEQALDITETLVRSGAVDMIVIDSVAALVPKAELEGEMGDSHMGLQARLMSQALRKLTPVVHKSKTVLVFINQIRQKIGTVSFGNPETTTGGNALKFYASLRVDIRRIASLKKGDEVIGNRIAVKLVKNKMAPPFRRVELDLLFSEGISHEACLIDMAIDHNLVTKSGAWLSIDGKQIAQGREQGIKYLKENAAVSEALAERVRAALQP